MQGGPTSAGMFRMIRRLAARSEDVERPIYWFDTHLTPNDANSLESRRRSRGEERAEDREDEFKRRLTTGGERQERADRIVS